jgi:hypothetical protein
MPRLDPARSDTRRSDTPLTRRARGWRGRAAGDRPRPPAVLPLVVEQPAICGITRFANSSVLCMASSRLMLPNWSRSMSWPTLQLDRHLAQLLGHLVGLPMIT